MTDVIERCAISAYKSVVTDKSLMGEHPAYRKWAQLDDRTKKVYSTAAKAVLAEFNRIADSVGIDETVLQLRGNAWVDERTGKAYTNEEIEALTEQG